MLKLSMAQRMGKWLAVAALLGFGLGGLGGLGMGLAMAQSEPTLTQIYETANAGKLDQAQVMMQQVLVAHPNSAKAHFVQAELSARQGQLGRAREALAMADKLAPGLPFAKAESVQNLRAQLSGNATGAMPGKSNVPAASSHSAAAMGAVTPVPAAPASSFPWGLALAMGGGAIALIIYTMRKKSAPAMGGQPAYANQGGMQGSGLSGPQGFGMGNNMANNPAYGGQAYGQPAGSGLGGKIAGGLATGLAVGAGVMAAQAIGKSFMGDNERPAHQPDSAAGNGYQPFASNNDLGGQNFGVNDAGSWDDGGSAIASSDGDGGDWDS